MDKGKSVVSITDDGHNSYAVGDHSRGLGGLLRTNSKLSDPFIDRSKVKILVCNSDDKSCEEVTTLLFRCSYKVIAVKSAGQAIDVLNSEGNSIDVILSEVDLPFTECMKMLKYIMHDKLFRRIPVIMLSVQDELPTVIKCLRLGAADYFVKPLHANELSNLWTHMWRRRRQLGLVEKNIFNYGFAVERSSSINYYEMCDLDEEPVS